MEKAKKMIVNRHVYERRPFSAEGYRVPFNPAMIKGRVRIGKTRKDRGKAKAAA